MKNRREASADEDLLRGVYRCRARLDRAGPTHPEAHDQAARGCSRGGGCSRAREHPFACVCPRFLPRAEGGVLTNAGERGSFATHNREMSSFQMLAMVAAG